MLEKLQQRNPFKYPLGVPLQRGGDTEVTTPALSSFALLGLTPSFTHTDHRKQHFWSTWSKTSETWLPAKQLIIGSILILNISTLSHTEYPKIEVTVSPQPWVYTPWPPDTFRNKKVRPPRWVCVYYACMNMHLCVKSACTDDREDF